MQADNPACLACGAICTPADILGLWICLVCGRYFDREEAMEKPVLKDGGGVEGLARQIVGGFPSFALGLVEAWRDLSPEEKMRLYLSLRDEAKRIAREKK